MGVALVVEALVVAAPSAVVGVALVVEALVVAGSPAPAPSALVLAASVVAAPSAVVGASFSLLTSDFSLEESSVATVSLAELAEPVPSAPWPVAASFSPPFINSFFVPPILPSMPNFSFNKSIKLLSSVLAFLISCSIFWFSELLISVVCWDFKIKASIILFIKSIILKISEISFSLLSSVGSSGLGETSVELPGLVGLPIGVPITDWPDCCGLLLSKDLDIKFLNLFCISSLFMISSICSVSVEPISVPEEVKSSPLFLTINSKLNRLGLEIFPQLLSSSLLFSGSSLGSIFWPSIIAFSIFDSFSLTWILASPISSETFFIFCCNSSFSSCDKSSLSNWLSSSIFSFCFSSSLVFAAFLASLYLSILFFNDDFKYCPASPTLRAADTAALPTFPTPSLTLSAAFPIPSPTFCPAVASAACTFLYRVESFSISLINSSNGLSSLFILFKFCNSSLLKLFFNWLAVCKLSLAFCNSLSISLDEIFIVPGTPSSENKFSFLFFS